MITETEGNLLRADVEALVNTVNTVGVMGKGIALQFKRAYPEMFKAYSRAAKAGEIQPGRVHVWETGSLTGPRYIINFPTKRHWRSPSRLEDIETGLADLARVLSERGIASVAVPPLGCGNGGLPWATVRPLILDELGGLDVEVQLFVPAGAPKATEMIDRRPPRSLTPARAALLKIVRDYEGVAFERPSLIEIQKLMYFLQAAGQPLRLNYGKGIYGPYADNLRFVLVELEGQFLTGYGDGGAKVQEAEPIQLLSDGGDEAERLIAADPDLTKRIERVLSLVRGWETPYGLELLASVHWLATAGENPVADEEAAFRQLSTWTARKRAMFTAEHVATAWRALQDHGWLPQLATVRG